MCRLLAASTVWGPSVIHNHTLVFTAVPRKCISYSGKRYKSCDKNNEKFKKNIYIFIILHAYTYRIPRGPKLVWSFHLMFFCSCGHILFVSFLSKQFLTSYTKYIFVCINNNIIIWVQEWVLRNIFIFFILNQNAPHNIVQVIFHPQIIIIIIIITLLTTVATCTARIHILDCVYVFV